MKKPPQAEQPLLDEATDALSRAGIRPWCRGLMIILAHPHNLNIKAIVDCVEKAAESGGLTPQETIMLQEIRQGSVVKEAQATRKIL